MATSQQYSLKWNNYLKHITYAFDNLRLHDDFVDVTLCCEGKKIKGHKVLLSACSGYFKEIFKENPCPHPVVIFKFIKYDDLHAIIEFMYQGEVNVQQEALQSFLQTAELLEVQGLTSEEKLSPIIPATSTKEFQEKIKKIPTLIRTVTESNTQTATTSTSIDLQQNKIKVMPMANSSKKRKVTYSEDDEDDDDYIETVEFTKENVKKIAERQYIPATMTVEVRDEPEFIEEQQEPKEVITAQIQQTQTSQDITTQTTSQFSSSEYEILSENDMDKFDNSGNTETSTNRITTVDIGNGQVYTVEEAKTNIRPLKSSPGGGISDLENPIICNHCFRHFQSTPALKRHKISKHTVRHIKYDCSVCQKAFKTKWSLSTHNSRFHRETKSKENIKMDINF